MTGGSAVLNHELLQPEGILVLRPEAPLEATDFQKLAQEVDPYIEANGVLHGIMLDAESFPGWKDFAALVAHLKFVKDHHHKVQKIAAVSDSTFLTAAPKIASHFVHAEVRHFPRALREEALAWLRGENQ
jgi:SpoIIAA-like